MSGWLQVTINPDGTLRIESRLPQAMEVKRLVANNPQMRIVELSNWLGKNNWTYEEQDDPQEGVFVFKGSF